MDYRQADRTIRAFKESRRQWMDILVRSDGENTVAAQTIATINAKIELLRVMRSYPSDYEGDFE